MKITHASNLSDKALIEEPNRLAGRERAATVALIVHLAEFDARRLYAGAGYSSTFRYCLEVLRLSEDAAFNRIEVARTARDHPLVLEMLLSGALSPTTARLLARRLTAQNHRELLAVAAGKSKQQAEELLARRFPQPDVPSPIRVLPVPASLGANGREVRAAGPEAPAPDAPGADSRPEAVRPAEPPGAVAPSRPLCGAPRTCSATRYPTATWTRCSTAPSDCSSRKWNGRSLPPLGGRGGAAGNPNGRRCGERRFLEFHHDDPWGVGGQPTIDRVRLLCRAHNGHEAEVFYGPGRRHGRGGADVAGEARAGYGALEDATRPGTGKRVGERTERSLSAGSHPASASNRAAPRAASARSRGWPRRSGGLPCRTSRAPSRPGPRAPATPASA